MTEKRTIIIFSLSYYPYVGGAEVAVKEITDRMPEVTFHLITARLDGALPQEEMMGNVVVHRVGWGKKSPTLEELSSFPWYVISKLSYPLLSAIAAYRLHKKYHIDGGWVIMAYAGFGLAILGLLSVRIPYLLTLQEGDPLEKVMGRPLLKPFFFLFKRIFSRAHTVQAISHYLGTWATEMGYGGEVAIIPNAVDSAHFSSRSGDQSHVYQRMKEKKQPGDVWLITTSRLVHKNAIDDVVRALALLPPHISFAVLGVGPDKEKLEALSKECGVSKRVHFFGYVDHHDLPACLSLGDIFIRPSRTEGMGNSFIEAMAAGLPVIATQEGGIADFLFDEKKNPDKASTGFAVDKDTPSHIADVVQRILDNPEATQKTIATAKAMVQKNYTWDSVTVGMRQLFAKIFEKK